MALRNWMFFDGPNKRANYQGCASQLHFTLTLGDKPQFVAPAWYFPSGGGIYGGGLGDDAVYNNGYPSQGGIMKLARPIIVPVRQNFNVNAEFFSVGSESALDLLNGGDEIRSEGHHVHDRRPPNARRPVSRALNYSSNSSIRTLYPPFLEREKGASPMQVAELVHLRNHLARLAGEHKSLRSGGSRACAMSACVFGKSMHSKRRVLVHSKTSSTRLSAVAFSTTLVVRAALLGPRRRESAVNRSTFSSHKMGRSL